MLTPLIVSLALMAKPPLPEPVVLIYGVPISYDVGYDRLIPPPAEKHYVEQGFKPDVMNWAMSSVNVFIWGPEQLARVGVDVEAAAAHWRAQGKIPLYNIVHSMEAFGQIDTATGFYEIYAAGMEDPHCDGIAIDEYGMTWISFDGQQERCHAVIEALRRIRADYPDKIIASWLAGFWYPEWDRPEAIAFLETLRDHTDLVLAELYHKERDAIPEEFPMFREILDQMEERAPGILKKTLPGLTISEHPEQEPPHNTVAMSDFAVAQLRFIKSEPVLRELPGIALFPAFRAYDKTLHHLDGVVTELYLSGKPQLPWPVVSTYGLPLSWDVGHNGLIPPLPAPEEVSKRREGFVLPVYDWEMETANVVCFHPKQVTDAGVDFAEYADHWRKQGKILLESLAVGLNIYTETATVEDIYNVYARAISIPHMDGVNIDEFMFDWVVNAPERAEVAAQALIRLRQDYPDKIIASWVSGWWGARWDHPQLKRFLEVLRDHTDLIQAEIYFKPTRVEPDPATLIVGRPLSPIEFAALQRVCADDEHPSGKRDTALLAVLYSCGIRQIERLSAIDREHFDAETGELVIPGVNGEAADRCSSSYLVSALKGWLEVRGDKPGPLFCPVPASGVVVLQRLTSREVGAVLADRAREAGVRACSPNDSECPPGEFRRAFVGDFSQFREYIDAMERLAPGISEKTVIALYTVDHPATRESDPAVTRMDYLRDQFEYIAADPVLRELDGIAFFAAYRCTQETLKGLDDLVRRHYR